MSPQQLSRLLGEFEANDIIERFPRGRSVFVCLGLRGQLIEERLAEAGVGAAQAAAAAAGADLRATQQLTALFQGGRMYAPFSSPPRASMTTAVVH
jgi:hypothetical protein